MTTSRIHSCNVYCRFPQHCDVFYTTWRPDQRGVAGPGGFVALDVEQAMRRCWPGVRLRVVEAQPAHEALPVEVARTLPEYGYLRRGDTEPAYAWLVTWEEGE